RQRRGVPARAAMLPSTDRRRDRHRGRGGRTRRVHSADDARPVQAADGIVRRRIRRAGRGGAPDAAAAPHVDGDERWLADVVARYSKRWCTGAEEGGGVKWLLVGGLLSSLRTNVLCER